MATGGGGGFFRNVPTLIHISLMLEPGIHVGRSSEDGASQLSVQAPVQFSSVQFSYVQFFVALWTAAHQAFLPGASVRNPADGKGHEEGGLTYAKAGSSLRGPLGDSRASTPKTRVCLPY